MSHMGLKELWRSRRRACSSGDLVAAFDMVMFSLVFCVVAWLVCAGRGSKGKKEEGEGTLFKY